MCKCMHVCTCMLTNAVASNEISTVRFAVDVVKLSQVLSIVYACAAGIRCVAFVCVARGTLSCHVFCKFSFSVHMQHAMSSGQGH